VCQEKDKKDGKC